MKIKGVLKRAGVMALALSMLIPVVPSQAAKLKLNKTKVTVYYDDLENDNFYCILKVKGTKKKVKWSCPKKYAKIFKFNNKCEVYPKIKGKFTVTAKVGKKKLKCVVFSRTINKKNENVSLEQTKINTNANIDTPKTINVESITLDKENVVMGTGETVKLNKQITPSNATTDICWSSSDNSIATVVDGNINAIKEGEIIISISSGEVIANCKVKVVKNKKEQIEEENKKYNEEKKKINDSYDGKIRSTEAEIRLLKSEGYYYGTYSQYRSEVLSLSKEITNLEKSWAAYEYDNSEENRYKKNQIKTNLANARRELSELEDSYANKQSIELYESLLDSFEVNRKSELTKLENTHTLNIEKINKLY